MKRSEFTWAANLFTIGNLLLGFWAIIQVFEGKFLTACWLIIIASILDGLDGKIARFTRGASEIGIEFDSLADVVSFGVAPALMLYTQVFHKFGVAGLVLSALPLIFGAARLARFNRSAVIGEKKYYEGLPIPIAADLIATFIIFNYAVWGTLRLEFLFVPLTIATALLMVSRIHYDTMPKFTFRDTRKNFVKLSFMLAGVVVIALRPSIIFFPLVMFYVLYGIAAALFAARAEEDELEEVLEE
jgi:CDP-diacylglycerol--serine O-phosphatidyltransferase